MTLLDETELRVFVETSVGGAVTGVERTAVGSSRVTFLVDVEHGDGETRALVVRHDSGDGPMSGTDINLTHEASVYRALANRDVRIPQLIAVAADGRSLLMERVRGSEAFGAIVSDTERAAVARDFGTALAELHALDPAVLELPDQALADLERWRAIQQSRVAAPGPMTRFAGEWLAQNAPAEAERTVLCHGDAGAGNFLHEDGRVTALLDWEFAHLGDPLDDVAWVGVRSHLLGGEAEMRDGLDTWSECSGLALDPERIRYYRALVLLRMAISCEVALSHANAGAAMDLTTYKMLLPYLGFLLPQALREAGCRDTDLDALEKRTKAEFDAIPALRQAGRPLTPWASRA